MYSDLVVHPSVYMACMERISRSEAARNLQWLVVHSPLLFSQALVSSQRRIRFPSVMLYFLSWAALVYTLAASAPVVEGLERGMPTSGGTGVAFSGGGVTALVATLSVQHQLHTRWPNATYVVSTASGGTLGYLLSQQDTTGKLTYPPPSPIKSLTYDSLRNTSAAHGEVWWANIVRLIPKIASYTEIQQKMHTSTEPFQHQDRNWWPTTLQELARLAYHIDLANTSWGSRPFICTFAAINSSACPVRRLKSGSFAKVDSVLWPGEYDGLRASLVGAVLLDQSGFHRPDFVAMSSAFWAASIVENGDQNKLFKSILMRANLISGGQTYLVDGGMVDTTGIAALLRRRTARIVSFYNNNDDLADLDSPYAYLFGVNTSTDTMNSMGGAQATQVFSASLYPCLLANLTGTSVRAHLQNVPVLRNEMLGIEPYVLEELLVFSNQRSTSFLEELTDAEIVKRLASQWPSRMPLSMGALEAVRFLVETALIQLIPLYAELIALYVFMIYTEP